VLASTSVVWAPYELRMPVRLQSATSIRSIPISPYLYAPPRRRWWPLLAVIAVAGFGALMLFGASQPTAAPDQKPLVHTFARTDGLAPLARHRPRVVKAGPDAPSVPDGPPVDLAAMRAEMAAADEKARAAAAPAEQVKTAAAPANAKRVQRVKHAAKKSRARDAYAYWGYQGGWGGYYGGGRRGWYN
jgi:hypothetical protein